MDCSMCGGPHELIGTLGRKVWYRCQDCGWTENWPADDDAILAANDENIDATIEEEEAR